MGPFTVAVLLRPVFLDILFGQAFPLESRVVPSLAPGATLSVSSSPTPWSRSPRWTRSNNLRNTADVTVFGQTLH